MRVRVCVCVLGESQGKEWWGGSLYPSILRPQTGQGQYINQPLGINGSCIMHCGHRYIKMSCH